MRTAEFKDRSGRDLDLWEVPLKDYLATKPATSFAQRAWRAVHAIAVARARRLGQDVPPRVLQSHSEQDLATAVLRDRVVLGDPEASAELRARRQAVRTESAAGRSAQP